MKVMIVVTHLLGTGHLARATTLALAYKKAGHIPCVVSGGMPAPVLENADVPLVQLPPVRSDGVDFSRLLDAGGLAVTDTYMDKRETDLRAALAQFEPDVLITELFPFGRRILRDEFHALLTAARQMAQPPCIYASIRDILAPPSQPKKAQFADDVIAEFYDGVLVHSDPALAPLEVSWPVSDKLRPKLQYTGFVSRPPAGPHPDGTGRGEVIVSAGGGDVGMPIYQAALAAAAQVERPFRLLVGGAEAQIRIDALRRDAPANVTIEAARPDFRQMLFEAAASVSLCGYNTALDILQANTPAVFVPFDEGVEVEQGLRANALAKRSGIAVVARADLSAARLAHAIEEVIAAPSRDQISDSFNGAQRSVEITFADWSTR